MFTIQSMHLTLNEKIDISYSAFIGCSSADGGGLLSNINADHLLKFCTFCLCAANTSSESRGGAFWIKKGNVIAKGCCSDSCKSSYGADILIHRTETLELSLSSSVNGGSANHGIFISSERNTEAKFSNISGYSVSQKNYYGSGFNVGYYGNIRASYLNLVKCDGSNGVFGCDWLGNANVQIKNINEVQNTNVEYYITLRKDTNSVVTVNDSLFLQSSCSSTYISYSVQDTSINFFTCSFSVSQPSDTSIYSSCTFNDGRPLSVDKYDKCQINFINKFCSFKIIRKQYSIIPFCFIPFIIES